MIFPRTPGYFWDFPRGPYDFQDHPRWFSRQSEMFTRPGKRLQKTMENHHAINWNIHYFDWAIFNSYVYVYLNVYQRCLHYFLDIWFQWVDRWKKCGILLTKNWWNFNGRFRRNIGPISLVNSHSSMIFAKSTSYYRHFGDSHHVWLPEGISTMIILLPSGYD